MYRKAIAIVLSALLIWSGLVTTAAAAVIGTRDALSMQTHEQRMADVQAVLARADVQQAMIDLGVDPLQAQQRVEALSPQELAQLQGRLDSVPAGGILDVIGLVFVILLILELTGVIDIFKKA
ncbi:MAG TPA: PA2779 family protein [Halioglobus sp.]